MERKLNDGKVIIKDNFWKRLYGVGTYFENFSDASKEYLEYAIEDTLYKLSNEPNIERTDDNFKDIFYTKFKMEISVSRDCQWDIYRKYDKFVNLVKNPDYTFDYVLNCYSVIIGKVIEYEIENNDIIFNS